MGYLAQGAKGVGLAGAGQSEGQDVDAAFQLLPHGQGERPPRSCQRPGLPATMRPASFLFQYLPRASPWVKRATDWAPMVGSLNWPHNDAFLHLRHATTRLTEQAVDSGPASQTRPAPDTLGSAKSRTSA